MATTIRCDIVSAEAEIFHGEAEMIVATGELGELGIAPRHAPLITRLKPGKVVVTLPGGEKLDFAISGGILEVQPQVVTVLADTAVRADEIDEAHFLLILNKNENIVPAVAKLEGPQAAAFFMLGETTGTSAGGADEAGKFLRVPGTNPFFPMPHDLQGNRFLELLAQHPLEVYVLNTGRVGGPDGDERSRKVRIKHSSAIVKGIAEGTVEWVEDPDFGYRVAASVPALPVSLDGARLPKRADPPRVGEHARELLASLGCSPQEIESLRDRGIVALPQSSSTTEEES